MEQGQAPSDPGRRCGGGGGRQGAGSLYCGGGGQGWFQCGGDQGGAGRSDGGGHSWADHHEVQRRADGQAQGHGGKTRFRCLRCRRGHAGSGGSGYRAVAGSPAGSRRSSGGYVWRSEGSGQ
ncbi:hypothetical protein L2088_10325 [Pseudomonas protegens]|nr:hypothetical protein [Pseudomonas protegens]